MDIYGVLSPKHGLVVQKTDTVIILWNWGSHYRTNPAGSEIGEGGIGTMLLGKNDS